jgi:hypothetical protein
MSSLIIEVAPELRRRMEEEARRRGQEVEDLARSVLEERFVAAEAARKRIEAFLAASRASVAASGATPEEIEAEIREAFAEVRAERQQARQAPPTTL